jgi:hypothetical protein
MSNKVTRRDLAAALLVAAQLPAQASPLQATPVQSSEDPLKAAAEDVRSSSVKLREFAVPMSTEPAFQFKA